MTAGIRIGSMNRFPTLPAMYSAARSLSPNLPTLSAPPFPRRSYHRTRTHTASRPAFTPLPTARVLDHDVAPQRIMRIFGYSAPAFVFVIIITLLCAVVPHLTSQISVPIPTSHPPVPSRTAEHWMQGLRGQ
jgi:hypothetical protein